MHVVILAGGRGVRLRPYTTSLPKPLVPIGDEYAILDIILRQLRTYGFTSVTLAIGHLGSLIRAFVGDGSQWDLSVDYAEEDKPLSTIGPMFNILDQLPEHFLVMNGDVLTDLDYGMLLREHIASEAPLTVATYNRQVKIDFGCLEAVDGTVVSFTEKPTLDYSVSMGIYGMSRKTLAPYPKGVAFGFDDLVLDLLDRNEPPSSHLFTGYWLDIGRPDDYDEANRTFDQIKPLLLPRPRMPEKSAPAVRDSAATPLPSPPVSTWR